MKKAKARMSVGLEPLLEEEAYINMSKVQKAKTKLFLTISSAYDLEVECTQGQIG